MLSRSSPALGVDGDAEADPPVGDRLEVCRQGGVVVRPGRLVRLDLGPSGNGADGDVLGRSRAQRVRRRDVVPGEIQAVDGAGPGGALVVRVAVSADGVRGADRLTDVGVLWRISATADSSENRSPAGEVHHEADCYCDRLRGADEHEYQRCEERCQKSADEK